ncbi:hypothetical protein UNPF46_11575 [Bradyrhizobium sp. UNPF46]|nr:hypothetical protein UNPF46_11575 [Bradyrhizobium sp. UNPF46]
MQRHRDPAAGSELAGLLPKIIRYLLDTGEYSSIDDAVGSAMDQSDYDAVVNHGASLARNDIIALLKRIDDSQVRLHFFNEARDASLMRRARLQRSFSFVYGLSPYEIYSKRIPFRTLSASDDRDALAQDYWTSLLYRTMHSLDVPVTPVTASNVEYLTEQLVDRPRRRLGEAAALRHAMILLYAYRYKQSFTDGDLLPLLNAIFVTIDLAAQVNDIFLQGKLIELLRNDVRCHLSGPPMDVCDRMISSTESTIIRHGLQFRPGSEAALRSHASTLNALGKLDSATSELGFISDNPRLGMAWMSTCFQGIQTSMAAGLPRSEVDRFVALYDKTGEKLGKLNLGFRPMSETLKSRPSDIYMSDLQTEMSIHRPNPTHSLESPEEEGAWGFDPEGAIAISSQALNALDHISKSADTAVASLRMGLAEAILCRNVRCHGPHSAHKWNDRERLEYKTAREAAVNDFMQLSMKWKLRRLARLELGGAGVVAPQWGMTDLFRKSRRAVGYAQQQ